jgi:hypothetical protein
MTKTKAEKASGLCNNKRVPVSEKDVLHRGWLFTRFNYTDAQFIMLSEKAVKNKGNKYIFGKEICPETKKPHIQGYINFKNGLTFNGFLDWLSDVFKDQKTNIMYAQKGMKANYIYCSKEENFVSNIEITKKKKESKEDIRKRMIALGKKLVIEKEYNNGDIKWRPYQQKILDIIEGKVDGRKVYYFWEKKGDVGKSFLSKWIRCIYKGVIVAEGKYSDVCQQCMNLIDNEQLPEIIILDLPRSFNSDFMSWTTIEKLKNGSIVSAKYEGGVLDFPKPHVIIFSNHCPDEDMLSKDRWEIIRISDIKQNDEQNDKLNDELNDVIDIIEQNNDYTLEL